MKLSKAQFEALAFLDGGGWRSLVSLNWQTRKSLCRRGLIEYRPSTLFDYRITSAGRVAYLDNRATGGS